MDIESRKIIDIGIDVEKVIEIKEQKSIQKFVDSISIIGVNVGRNIIGAKNK